MPIFLLAGCDFKDSPELNLLFKAFNKSTIKRRIRPPHWDVNVVLSSLKKAPYEPPSLNNLEAFTMKTLFLVSLATANRVGEIQALSDQVGRSADCSLIIFFSYEFLAKTEIHRISSTETSQLKPSHL